MKTWKEFQKAIIDQYGSLYGYLGPEISRALGLWLKDKTGERQAKGRLTTQMHPQGPLPKIVRQGTSASRIYDAMNALGGEATIQQVASHLNQKYGSVNASTVSTDMSDLAINGPPSSLYHEDQKFLERVARARYRLIK